MQEIAEVKRRETNLTHFLSAETHRIIKLPQNNPFKIWISQGRYWSDSLRCITERKMRPENVGCWNITNAYNS